MSAEAMQISDGASRYVVTVGAQDVPPGYKRTGIGVIPEDWGCRSVASIAASERNAIVGGPFGSDLVSKDYVEHGVPVIRGQNMNGQWIAGPFVFVTPEKAKSLSANLARHGDVIFTQRGTLGQVSVVPEQPFEIYLVSQSQMKVTLNKDLVESIFIFYVFCGSMHQRVIHEATIQTGVPHINLGILRAISVQVPSIKEQRAISEALSDVDGLLGALEALIAKKHAIKQAAVQQLLTGKTRLPGFSGKWEKKPLGDSLLSRPRYGINAPAVPQSDRLTTYIRITDITDGRFKPAPRMAVESAGADRFLLADGDIVLARTGASVGKSYRYRVEDGPLVFAGFLIRIQPDPNVLVSGYLAAYLMTEYYWNWVRLMSTRSGQPGINSNEYAQLPILLPSVDEQTAIATVLSDIDAEIAVLQARRDKIRAMKQGMMQQLLTGRVRLISRSERA